MNPIIGKSLSRIRTNKQLEVSWEEREGDQEWLHLWSSLR